MDLGRCTHVYRIIAVFLTPRGRGSSDSLSLSSGYPCATAERPASLRSFDISIPFICLELEIEAARVRRSLTGFLLVVIVLLCPRAWAQQDLVTEIVIHGNRRIPADTVKARIFTHPGDVYDAAGLERDFNSLWNTGYFEDIRFEREQTPKGWRIHVYRKREARPSVRSTTPG